MRSPSHRPDQGPSQDPKPQQKPVQTPLPAEDVSIPEHFRSKKIKFTVVLKSGQVCIVYVYSEAEALRQAEADHPGDSALSATRTN